MKYLVIWNYIIISILFHFHFVKNELIFVYEHCRHGGRGSMVNDPSIKYNDTFYDEYKTYWKGNGELTVKGKMQQYILGISNRYKYPNLINYTKYNPDELLIHVTNTSRVKESAYNQLLGMFNPIIKKSEINELKKTISESNIFYYPPNYNIWNNNKEDNISKIIIEEAELTIKLLEEIDVNKNESFLTEGKFNLEEINEKNKMNIKYFPYLENRTFYIIFNCLNNKKYMKYNYQNQLTELVKNNLINKYGDKLLSFFKYDNKEYFYDYRNIIKIIDNFISNYYEEKDLTKFHEETGIDKQEYYKICVKLYKWWLYNIYCDKKTCILESGKLMEDLIEYMDNKINNRTSKLNMVIDVGHDITVGPMQLFMHETFNIDFSVCHFSCNIYFELHKDKKDLYYVKYFIDDELRLTINYELFKKNVLSKLWTEKEKNEFCNGNIIKVLYPKGYLFLIFLVICISVGIIVFILCNYCIKNNKGKNKKKLLIKKENINENDETGRELEII